MENYCNNVAPVKRNARSQNFYEKRDGTESVSEHTQVLFSYNTGWASHFSGRQSGEKSTRGKRRNYDEVLATFLKSNSADGLFDKLLLQS